MFREKIKGVGKKAGTVGLITVLTTSTPALAVHDSIPCEVPESLGPLVELLHSIAELAVIAGIVLGVIGFSAAGIMLLLPGEDWTIKGRKTFKNVLVGVIILLSARMMIGYLVSQLPVC